MSDPYGSFDNPYGAPPPYPNQPSSWPPPSPQQPGLPPGPPPGAPPAPPQGPPTVPPPVPPPGRSSGYGQDLPPGTPLPSPYLPAPYPSGAMLFDDRRPGVVTAGALIAIVLSALGVAVGLLGVLGVVLYRADPDPGDSVSTGDLIAGIVVCGLVVVASAFAIVLGALALRRLQWARITLVVLGFVAFFAVLPLITSVLLLLPSAGRWYAGRAQRVY